MLTGPEFVAACLELGITHIAWVPDSAIGPWETAIELEAALRLVRVCREGEAWAIAGGLHLGGQRPLVVIQNTGLFESGDALRNMLFDLKLPLFALIGYRSYLVPNSPDTARRFTEPILSAWGLDYLLLGEPHPAEQFVQHYRKCREAGRPGAVLLPEGRM